MTSLPNPWIADSVVAAADPSLQKTQESPSSTGGCQEASAPATEPGQDVDATDISDVHEIFYHARKLIAEEEYRFVLDQRAFMEAIEPMPIFLRARA